jgi:hypothetical protein
MKSATADSRPITNGHPEPNVSEDMNELRERPRTRWTIPDYRHKLDAVVAALRTGREWPPLLVGLPKIEDVLNLDDSRRD